MVGNTSACHLAEEKHIKIYVSSLVGNLNWKLKMTVETNPNYWDCECETNFIHAKAQTLACSLCGMTEDESPDSRVNEIKENEDA